MSEHGRLRADSQICVSVFVRKFSRETRQGVGGGQRAGRGGSPGSVQS